MSQNAEKISCLFSLFLKHFTGEQCMKFLRETLWQFCLFSPGVACLHVFPWCKMCFPSENDKSEKDQVSKSAQMRLSKEIMSNVRECQKNTCKIERCRFFTARTTTTTITPTATTRTTRTDLKPIANFPLDVSNLLCLHVQHRTLLRLHAVPE